MNSGKLRRAALICTLVAAAVWMPETSIIRAQQGESSGGPAKQRDLLFVVTPGRVNDIAYGGVGILVFDAKDHYRFVKRIPTWDYPASQEPEDVRGVTASTATGLLHVSTIDRMAAFSLTTDKKVWEQTYEGGCCDRQAVSPDGKILYAPSMGKRLSWLVIDALTGKLIKKLDTPATRAAHNTIYSLDGSRVYMAGVSNTVSVADPKTHTVVQTIGPFGAAVRPFVVNGKGTLMFANVNDLLGFEVADLQTGKILHRVQVQGFGWSRDRITGHTCPSHGIAMSPDEKEIWVADGINGYLHVFDATVMPPKQIKSIPTRAHPYWITFGLDGKYVYPSSGDVIDAATKTVVAGLTDEVGRNVESEKLVEVLFVNGKPTRVVDQFGVGLVR